MENEYLIKYEEPTNNPMYNEEAVVIVKAETAIDAWIKYREINEKAILMDIRKI